MDYPEVIFIRLKKLRTKWRRTATKHDRCFSASYCNSEEHKWTRDIMRSCADELDELITKLEKP